MPPVRSIVHSPLRPTAASPRISPSMPFFGPDIGSFYEWLASNLGFFAQPFGSALADYILDPFYYVLILGIPLCVFYSWVCRILLQRKILDSFFGENGHSCLQNVQENGHSCLQNVQENGHSSVSVYLDIEHWLVEESSTHQSGCCFCCWLPMHLVNWRVYLYRRVKSLKFSRKESHQSLKLIMIIASLYCLWCVSQIYLIIECSVS